MADTTAPSARTATSSGGRWRVSRRRYSTAPRCAGRTRTTGSRGGGGGGGWLGVDPRRRPDARGERGRRARGDARDGGDGPLGGDRRNREARRNKGERVVRLGIFARTFSCPSLEGVLDAVAGHGLCETQFNMSVAGLSSMPEELDSALADRVREAAAR